LSTKTFPKIYYKPWKLLPEEDEQIARQIAETDAAIERELQEAEESNRRYQQDEEEDDLQHPERVGRDLGRKEDDEKSIEKHEDTEMVNDTKDDDPIPGTDAPKDAEDPVTSINENTTKRSEDQLGRQFGAGEDIGDGEIVEGEEDTVIY
jgi:hypothetical protein